MTKLRREYHISRLASLARDDGSKLLSILAIVLAATLAQPVRAQAPEIEISGRVQTIFNTTTADSEPRAEWLLRRVRLEAEVTVNDLISGKVQPDFAGGELSLKDAYLKLAFTPAFEVLVGRAHRPFSLLELTSSKRMPPIERGAAIRGVGALEEYELVHGLDYSDRDVGLQVMGAPAGAPLGFEYAVGVFGGPLQGEVGNANTYQLAGRATVQPTEMLKFGLGISNRDFHEVGPGVDETDLTRGNAVEMDLEYGSFGPGFHLLAEVATGELDPARGDDFLGAQTWLAYRHELDNTVVSTIEPTMRVSYGDADLHPTVTTASGGTLLTPGLNLYLGGLNRVMVNYDVWLPAEDGDAEGSFKAMFQLVF
ncbi:MAG TPA: porin [Longimicrobiaceae bacterium]|nr:porin [Longimicrobiaceae bacterium]